MLSRFDLFSFWSARPFVFHVGEGLFPTPETIFFKQSESIYFCAHAHRNLFYKNSQKDKDWIYLSYNCHD